MLKTASFVVAILLTLSSPAWTDPVGFSDQLVVGGLQAPTSFAFLPSGEILVAQRGGAVRLVQGGVLQADPLLTVATRTDFERGLLGLVVDPAFAQNRWVYLYYTTADAAPVNRVVRFSLAANWSVQGPFTILDNIPSTTGLHNAGAMAFGPDGKLYVAVGDNNELDKAQSLGTLAGKVLRINPDGTIPGDNPFAGTGGARAEIWHYGLRNPFRFTITSTGRMFIGDVGQASYEEIDVAEATQKGLNFGWPCREGRHEGLVTDAACEATALDPIHEYPHAGGTPGAASITVGAVSGSGVYPPAYSGVLFFADFVRGFIDTLAYAGGSASVARFGDGRHTTVAFATAPDGRIYYASLALGQVRKIVHSDFPELTPLTISAVATPAAAQPRELVLVAATVGTNQPQGLAVVADLSSIGGASTQALVDDGTSGDATSGDRIFSWRTRVGAGVTPGAKNLPLTVTDGFGRSTSTTLPVTVLAVVDGDADGLPDLCETSFGLDPASFVFPWNSNSDADNDGATNLSECTGNTHPAGFFTRMFAEGVSSPLFTTQFAVANTRTVGTGQTTGVPNAHVHFRFQRNDGVVVTHTILVPPQTRRTVDVSDIAGLASAEFATVVESDLEVTVDRTVSWSTESYGAHGEGGLGAASATWYFAEGATHSGFNLFYLLQNPNASAATVQVEYLLPPGQAPITRSYTVPPQSRVTVWVNQVNAALAATDVSARLSSNLPIVAERAMYRDDASGLFWSAGHGGAGAPSPATSWFFAEGATGSFFDLYMLLANPSSTPAQVSASYLRPTGAPVQRTYTVAPRSRLTIFVDGQDPLLADTAVSAQFVVTNGVPIVAERAMWWPGPTSASWVEAHSSLGSTSPAKRWTLADGRVGGAQNAETYVLIANLSNASGQARVRVFLDDGTLFEKTYNLAPTSRRNVNVGVEFPGTLGHSFGALVDSMGTSPVDIVVEHAVYWDSGTQHWAAGTSAIAQPPTSTSAELAVTGGGPSSSQVVIPVGGRLRVTNGTSTDRWLQSADCSALAPIGRLRPSESAVTGVFTSPRVCTIVDALSGMLPVTLTVQ